MIENKYMSHIKESYFEFFLLLNEFKLKPARTDHCRYMTEKYSQLLVNSAQLFGSKCATVKGNFHCSYPSLMTYI